jgi:hypothetical protein
MEPMRVADDMDANRIELVETIRLGRVWRLQSDGRAAFTTPDVFFRGNIPEVPQEGRRRPIAVGPPLRATSTIDIRSPLPAPPTEWDERLEAPGIQATSKFHAVNADKTMIRLSRTLTLSGPVIEAADAPALASLRDKLTPKSSVAIRQPVRDGRVYKPILPKKQKTFDFRLFALIISGALILLGMLSHVLR